MCAFTQTQMMCSCVYVPLSVYGFIEIGFSFYQLSIEMDKIAFH